MTILSRAIGLLLWAAAAAVSIWLTFKLTGGDQIITALSLLAIAAGSFTLLMARSAWRAGAYPEFAVNVAIWLFSAVSLLFLDISYYSGSIDAARTREEVAAITRDTQTLMLTKAKNAYASAAEIRSPGEIKALMAQAALKFGPNSNQYLKLNADYEAAVASENLRRDIWAVGTSLEKVDVSRGMAGAATFFHKNFGGSLDAWIMAAVLTPVLLLWLIMHGGLFASTGTRRLRVQQNGHSAQPVAFATPDGAKPVLPPAEPVFSPPPPAPEPPKPGKKRRTLSEMLSESFKPGALKVVGGRDHINTGVKKVDAPETREIASAPAQGVLAISAARTQLPPASEPENASSPRPQVTEGLRAVMKIVRLWLEDNWEDVEITSDMAKVPNVSAKDAFENFDRWRYDAGFDEIKNNSYGRAMKKLGYHAKHTKRGMVYPAARLTHRAKPQRMVA